MTSKRGMVATIALLLLMAGGVYAQGAVRGQIVLPGGATPRMQIRFYLTSGDGLLNDYRFSDTNGRFVLSGLNNRVEHTITVDGDGTNWATTIYKFMPQYETTPRIYLNAIPSKPVAKPATVSAASGYKPSQAAMEADEAGIKAMREDRPEEAEKLLRQAVAADPKYPAAHIHLGALLLQVKKLEEAEKVLRQALELDAKSAFAQMSLGMVLNRLNRFAEAVPPLQEAIRLNSELVTAHVHLGVALVETEQFEEAERQLNIADNATGTEEVVRYLYLGQLYARTNRYEKSISAFETYLQKAPNDKNAESVKALLVQMKQELAKRK